MPVVSSATGKVLGRYAHAVFRPGIPAVSGICFEKNGVFRRKLFVPFEDIEVLGQHAVVIGGQPGALQPAKAAAKSSGLGTRIYNHDGVMIGRLAELWIDETSGRILGMVVQQSIIDDLRTGRIVLEDTASITETKGCILINTHPEAKNRW